MSGWSAAATTIRGGERRRPPAQSPVPMIRWSEEREAELAELAAKGAGDLSVSLGHRGVAR